MGMSRKSKGKNVKKSGSTHTLYDRQYDTNSDSEEENNLLPYNFIAAETEDQQVKMEEKRRQTKIDFERKLNRILEPGKPSKKQHGRAAGQAAGRSQSRSRSRSQSRKQQQQQRQSPHDHSRNYREPQEDGYGGGGGMLGGEGGGQDLLAPSTDKAIKIQRLSAIEVWEDERKEEKKNTVPVSGREVQSQLKGKGKK